MNPYELQNDFDLFYEDIFMELAKYGEIEEMNICDNVGDHLYEEDAGKACDSLNSRFYAGRPLYAELSPVTDFNEACCRQYENAECTRGGFCNFMHLKQVTKDLKRELFQAQKLSIQILNPRPEEAARASKPREYRERDYERRERYDDRRDHRDRRDRRDDKRRDFDRY
ncbi:Splicing factor U2AF 26 kDa subunit [Boothiomyces sp. JEL0866]|nr:Splicing factor U2AF 26 kDa subunit [Boothiomyces sp. JEL0866]